MSHFKKVIYSVSFHDIHVRLMVLSASGEGQKRKWAFINDSFFHYVLKNQLMPLFSNQLCSEAAVDISVNLPMWNRHITTCSLGVCYRAVGPVITVIWKNLIFLILNQNIAKNDIFKENCNFQWKSHHFCDIEKSLQFKEVSKQISFEIVILQETKCNLSTKVSIFFDKGHNSMI